MTANASLFIDIFRLYGGTVSRFFCFPTIFCSLAISLASPNPFKRKQKHKSNSKNHDNHKWYNWITIHTNFLPLCNSLNDLYQHILYKLIITLLEKISKEKEECDKLLNILLLFTMLLLPILILKT